MWWDGERENVKKEMGGGKGKRKKLQNRRGRKAGRGVRNGRCLLGRGKE